jgi:hypothetical protein
MPSIVDAEQRVANKLSAVGNIYNQENINLQLSVSEKKKKFTPILPPAIRKSLVVVCLFPKHPYQTPIAADSPNKKIISLLITRDINILNLLLTEKKN